MTGDYPHLRRALVCPRCQKRKVHPTPLCGYCYNALELSDVDLANLLRDLEKEYAGKGNK